MKLLCSLGGRILPHPGDGTLRYAGGDTRIMSVPRGVSLPDLLARLADSYSGATGPHFAVKYQLPDERLDALISVSSTEDLDNMVEEYDKLSGASPKLRVFIFPILDAGGGSGATGGGEELETGSFDAGLRYLEAMNGIVRKDSIASLSSMQYSDGGLPPTAPSGGGGSGPGSPAALSPTSTSSNDVARSNISGAGVAPPPLVDVFSNAAPAPVQVKPQEVAAEGRAPQANPHPPSHPATDYNDPISFTQLDDEAWMGRSMVSLIVGTQESVSFADCVHSQVAGNVEDDQVQGEPFIEAEQLSDGESESDLEEFIVHCEGDTDVDELFSTPSYEELAAEEALKSKAELHKEKRVNEAKLRADMTRKVKKRAADYEAGIEDKGLTFSDQDSEDCRDLSDSSDDDGVVPKTGLFVTKRESRAKKNA